jgi:uncharacterized protein YciI
MWWSTIAEARRGGKGLLITSSNRFPGGPPVPTTSPTRALAAAVSLVLLALVAPHPANGAEPPFEMEPFQLVLLLRPADRKTIPDAEAEAIQKQHIAHLEKMGRSGKMVVAGPFDGQRDVSLRGACIYRVATADEARALAEADPAVKAGRLRVEVVTWYVGKGTMTFPKAPPADAAR